MRSSPARPRRLAAGRSAAPRRDTASPDAVLARLSRLTVRALGARAALVVSWVEGAVRVRASFGDVPAGTLRNPLSLAACCQRAERVRGRVVAGESGGSTRVAAVALATGGSGETFVLLGHFAESRTPTDDEVAVLEDLAAGAAAELDALALHESVAVFDQIVENVRDVFWIFTHDFERLLYVSPAYERITGIPLQRIYAEPRGFLEAVHPDDLPVLLAAMDEVRHDRVAQGIEFRFTRSDGTLLWALVQGYPVRDEQGEVCRVVGVAKDITQRKLAEAAYRGSEERAQRVAERMHAVAAAAAGVLGARTPEELDAVLRGACKRVLPHDVVTFGSYDAAEHALTFVAAWDGDVFDAGGTYRLSGTPSERVVRDRRSLLTLRADDPAGQGAVPFGTSRRSESAIRTPVLGGDRVLGVISVQSYTPDLYTPSDVEVLEAFAAVIATALQNIELLTARAEAEAALRASEQRYRSFFDGDITAAVLSGPDGEVIDCNPAFLHIFGFDSVDEARGARLAAIYPSAAARESFLERIRRERRVEHLEQELRHRSGRVVHVIENAFGLFDERGELLQIQKYLYDITEHKRLEGELRQAQKLEAVGRLAGGIAHDFNNMLTAISGHVDLLLDEQDPADALRDGLLEIRRAAERSADLTQQLLAFSRKQMLQPRVLDFNDVVSGMSGMLRRLLGEDVELVTELGRDLAPVRADPGQMEQVVLNLAVNARDAMPGGGRLTIRTEVVTHDRDCPLAAEAGVAPGRYVVLAVGDTGSGMDEGTKARIFEPFFTTKALGKGTGLGLATVYGIVKQSGGFVLVDSAPGRGSTFRVNLPVAARADTPADAPSAAPRLPGGEETVLLVEDEPAVRALVARVLRKGGYTVLEADCGERALELAGSHAGAIHLILTDVVMPQMSGRAFVDRLPDARRAARVLFMSGYTDEDVGRHGVLGRETPFLQKPFGPRALLEKVREVLGGAEA